MEKNPYKLVIGQKKGKDKVLILQKRKPSLFVVSRNIGIAIGALILTTFFIQAADSLQNDSQSVLGLALEGVVGQEQRCERGMVFVDTSQGGFCIDAYEASVSSACSYPEPQTNSESQQNLTKPSCKAVSEEGREPWTNIARHQAELACSNAGKRLPTNKEWYRAALGTPDSKVSFERGDCNINSETNTGEKTGSFSKCISNAGTYDMIGNVWEWVGETTDSGMYLGRKLPSEGYVTDIDMNGVPVQTRDDGDLNFNSDYFWMNEEGVNGMIRGGYSKSGTDGGVYTINTAINSSFAGAAIGFRCVK